MTEESQTEIQPKTQAEKREELRNEGPYYNDKKRFKTAQLDLIIYQREHPDEIPPKNIGPKITRVLKAIATPLGNNLR